MSHVVAAQENQRDVSAPEHKSSRRLNPRHQDMVREKIRASMLVVRLQAFALGRKIGGKVVNMSAEQVRSAFGLLDKILPDLKQVELVGDPDRPVEVRSHEVTSAAAAALEGQTPTEAVVTYESLILGRDTTAPGSSTVQ